MPKYKVTIEAKRIVSLSTAIEIEAKNKTVAKLEIARQINQDIISDEGMEEIDSYIADMNVADIEEID